MLPYVASCVILFLVMLSVLARANDNRKKTGFRSHLRMTGLVLMFAAPLGMAGYELTAGIWPNWYEVAFRAGVLFVLMTTPGQPPWNRWLWRGDEK